MNNQLLSTIQKWVLDGPNEYAANKNSSLHINELINCCTDTNQVIEITLQALSILQSVLREHKLDVKCGVVFPLEVLGNKLEFAVPKSMYAMNAAMDLKHEYPSLYYYDWSLVKLPESCEEYRCPLPFAFSQLLSDEFLIYYRESRDLQAIKKDWEFSRGIYIEASSMKSQNI